MSPLNGLRKKLPMNAGKAIKKSWKTGNQTKKISKNFYATGILLKQKFKMLSCHRNIYVNRCVPPEPPPIILK